MSYIYTADEFIAKLKNAMNFRNYYVMGCFGWPLNYGDNLNRCIREYEYNKKHETEIRKAAKAAAKDGVEIFGFDCVNFTPKAILWGWCGDPNAEYGGVRYQSNGVPDATIDVIFNEYCTDQSEEWGNVVPGEFLYYGDGSHCGVYVGDGMAIEMTAKWTKEITLSAITNMGAHGEKERVWQKHAKLQWIDYSAYTSSGYYIYLGKDLKRGDKGDEVKKLQMRLRQISQEYDKEVAAHSFTNGKPDGSFGPSMEKTVQKLQQQAGLGVTGVMDYETRQVLNESILKWHDLYVGAEATIANVRNIVN